MVKKGEKPCTQLRKESTPVSSKSHVPHRNDSKDEVLSQCECR
jgi:hypothetical protein